MRNLTSYYTCHSKNEDKLKHHLSATTGNKKDNLLDPLDLFLTCCFLLLLNDILEVQQQKNLRNM